HRIVHSHYRRRVESELERQNIQRIADQPSGLQSVFDLHSPPLLAGRRLTRRQLVASVNLGTAISVIGYTKGKSGLTSLSKTTCIVCLQRKNHPRRPFAGNGRRLALSPLRRQTTYKQKRALHTRIQVTKLYLKGKLAATWTDTSQASQRQARSFVKLCST
ncbi:hypothetical protein LTR16_004104, partial [Cryomyces antarcticus]